MRNFSTFTKCAIALVFILLYTIKGIDAAPAQSIVNIDDKSRTKNESPLRAVARGGGRGGSSFRQAQEEDSYEDSGDEDDGEDDAEQAQLNLIEQQNQQNLEESQELSDELEDDLEDDDDEEEEDVDGDEVSYRRYRRETDTEEISKPSETIVETDKAEPPQIPNSTVEPVVDQVVPAQLQTTETTTTTTAATPLAPLYNRTSVLILIRDALKKVTTVLPTEQVATNAIQYFQLFENLLQETIKRVIDDYDDDDEETTTTTTKVDESNTVENTENNNVIPEMMMMMSTTDTDTDIKKEENNIPIKVPKDESKVEETIEPSKPIAPMAADNTTEKLNN